jgi:tetratricopeptide (TPR) repeat protein
MSQSRGQLKMFVLLLIVVSLCTPTPALRAKALDHNAPSASGSSDPQGAKARVNELREAARRAPQSAEIHNELGLALGEAGDLAGAVAELNAATRLDGNFSQAHYNLGVTYLKRAKLARGSDDVSYYNDLESASNEFRRAYQLAPDLPMIHLQLGWIDQEIGDSSAALEEFQLAVKEAPHSAEAYYNLASAFANARSFDEAIKGFDTAVRLNPHLVAAVLGLESVRQLHGNQASVLELRRATVRQQPNSALAHVLLGHVLYVAGQAPGAVTELRKAIALDPGLAVARFYLGQALRQTGDLGGAVDQFQQASSQSPDVFEFQIELGLALLQLNRTDESISVFRKAVQQKPNNAEAHYCLGRPLQKLQSKAGAQKEFGVANELRQADRNREDAGLYVINGIQDLRSGKINEAVNSLRQAVAHAPEYPEANYYLGIALAQSGDGDAAVGAFQRAHAEKMLPSSIRERHSSRDRSWATSHHWPV